MATPSRRLDIISMWFLGGGLLLAIIGGSLINSAYSSVNSLIAGDQPGGELVAGWVFVGIGGMLLQAGVIGLLFWFADPRGKSPVDTPAPPESDPRPFIENSGQDHGE